MDQINSLFNHRKIHLDGFITNDTKRTHPLKQTDRLLYTCRSRCVHSALLVMKELNKDIHRFCMKADEFESFMLN